MKFFLDTYALIEMAEGNGSFDKYLDSECMTLKDNLAELYYYMLRRYGEEAADKELGYFSKIAADYNIAVIPHAVKLRLLENKKGRNLSYIDVLGYAFARKNSFIFLTGDRAFAKLEGVEIVR
ncbi:PIN domain-containing protein [Candidatus Woesearchaeota archaeon]|nr:PIN domain-containing protein [Candidatus Woesearchaeota archaeon]